MNEDLKSILEVVGGLVWLVSMALIFLSLLRMNRQQAKLPSMSTEELRSLLSKQPVLHSNKILEQLKSRGEDITFALPILFELALQRNVVRRLVGWGGLSQYFADTLPTLDFSKHKPTPAERSWMQSQLDRSEEPKT